MTTLGAALDSTAVQMRIDAAVSDLADYYQIDDEVVHLLSDRQAVADQLAGDRTLWRVERGVSGTTAASHLNGATLTPLYPQIASSAVETGGSGVTVDNTVDPPFAATGLIAPGAVQSGSDADLSGVLQMRMLTADLTYQTTGIFIWTGPVPDSSPIFTVKAGWLLLDLICILTTQFHGSNSRAGLMLADAAGDVLPAGDPFDIYNTVLLPNSAYIGARTQVSPSTSRRSAMLIDSLVERMTLPTIILQDTPLRPYIDVDDVATSGAVTVRAIVGIPAA